jgi:hypothetical protein
MQDYDLAIGLRHHDVAMVVRVLGVNQLVVQLVVRLYGSREASDDPRPDGRG